MRFLTVLVLICLFFACKRDTPAAAAPEQTAPPAVPAVPVDTVLISLGPLQFDTLLNTKRNIMLFDLRPHSEYVKGHIWRSTSMDATDSLFYHRLAALGKEAEFALYDYDGHLAKEAGQKMKDYGFRKIYILRDGLVTWGETGRALQLK